MKMKKQINAAMMSMAIAAALAGQGIAAESIDQRGAMKRENFAIASVIYEAVTTNASDVTSLMTNDAKKDWDTFFSSMVLDGKQYFMPDFFKVKHLIVGGTDQNGFVMGFYNPFYDLFAVFVVENGSTAKISGVRFCPGVAVRGESRSEEFPLASGLNPPDEYVSLLFGVMKSSTAAFLRKLGGKDFRSSFASLEGCGTKEMERIAVAHKFRIGQIIKLSEDKDLLAKVALATSILRDADMGASGFAKADVSTRKVLDMLESQYPFARNAFQVVAYFPSGTSANVVFSNDNVRSMIVHANISADGMVWLKLLDMGMIDVRPAAGL